MTSERPIPLPLSASALARFWSRIDTPAEPDRCWEWQSTRNDAGYGVLSLCSVYYRVHRIMWALEHGPIPQGLYVLHDCDNPPCVNPAHLFLGTKSDNSRDMVAKGRNVAKTHPELLARGERSPVHQHPELYRGEKHGKHKLTWEQVRTIRRMYAEGGVSQPQLGRIFGVTHVTIGNIVRHKIWREETP